jgi:hypothetical protein
MYPCCLRGNGGVHASHNVAKKVLEWEYVVEILRTDLRLPSRERVPGACLSSALFHEGSLPQGSGVPHAQTVWQTTEKLGGLDHV